jgi:hypothetical protein
LQVPAIGSAIFILSMALSNTEIQKHRRKKHKNKSKENRSDTLPTDDRKNKGKEERGQLTWKVVYQSDRRMIISHKR